MERDFNLPFKHVSSPSCFVCGNGSVFLGKRSVFQVSSLFSMLLSKITVFLSVYLRRFIGSSGEDFSGSAWSPLDSASKWAFTEV